MLFVHTSLYKAAQLLWNTCEVVCNLVAKLCEVAKLSVVQQIGDTVCLFSTDIYSKISLEDCILHVVVVLCAFV